jgi:hypothetical protein
MAKKAGIQAPWTTTYNKICALFNNDLDLHITDLTEKTEGNYTFTISSVNGVKLDSIKKILKNHFEFGNVTMDIEFIPENDDDKITDSDFRNAFNCNENLAEVRTIETPDGFSRTYVVFEKEVVQFYNDDLTDLYGNYNGLMEDIARELFNEVDPSISYCTADV